MNMQLTNCSKLFPFMVSSLCVFFLCYHKVRGLLSWESDENGRRGPLTGLECRLRVDRLDYYSLVGSNPTSPTKKQRKFQVII